MRKYYDCEVIIKQEATYMLPHKDISSLRGGIDRIREDIKEESVRRLKEAGAKIGNVDVEIILHESTPPPEPVPCPLCGAKTVVEEREQFTTSGGKNKLCYIVSHSVPLVDENCPLALAAKPVHKCYRNPIEAIKNWNRWCSHEQS